MVLTSTPVGVSLILVGLKFNTGWCESDIKLTLTGVEINTTLVWPSQNNGVLNSTAEFLQCGFGPPGFGSSIFGPNGYGSSGDKPLRQS